MSEDVSPSQDDKLPSWRFLRQIEVNQTLTALYLIIEAGRWQRLKGEDGSMWETVGLLRSKICSRFSGADIHYRSWPWSLHPDSLDKDDC